MFPQVAFKQSQLFGDSGQISYGLEFTFDRECMAYEEITVAGGHPHVLQALAVGKDIKSGWGGLVTPLMYGDVER